MSLLSRRKRLSSSIDESVKQCDPLPKDVVQVGKPKKYDRTPDFGLKVPQLVNPGGKLTAFTGKPFTVGDQLLWGAAEPIRRMLRVIVESSAMQCRAIRAG